MQRAMAIRDQRYFPNITGRECFNSAISNLLVELDDIYTARYFFANYRHHELVIDGGVDHYLSTRVINDIIGDKYKPVLFTKIIRNLQDYYDKEKLNTIKEEIAQKRIVSAEKCSPSFPCIFAFRKGSLAHTVVANEDGTFIDDGRDAIHKDLDILGIITLTHI